MADPDRHLSKTHCVISIEGGQWILTDLSTNGVFINGARQPTIRDSRVVLTDGDEFRVGEYSFVAEDAPEQRGGSAHMAATHDGDPLDVDPLDDPLGAPMPRDAGFTHPVRHAAPSARGEDPFDRDDDEKHRRVDPDSDLFRGVKPAVDWVGPSQSDHADAPRHAMAMPRVVQPVNMGEIDFDALIGDLSDLQPGRSPAPAAPPQPSPQPSSQPSPAQPSPQPGPMAPPSARQPPPASVNPFDSFDAFIDEPAPPAPVQAPVAPAAPVARAAPERAPAPSIPVAQSPVAQNPEARSPAAPNPAPASPAPAAPAAGAEPAVAPAEAMQAAMRAFLDGAGITSLPKSGDPEAAIRAWGQMFRVMTEGLREVLMSRAAVKGELQVEQTMIKATNNNPLKFSMSPEDAVMALLMTGRTGYMQPLAAAREAFDDIKTHELAVMAGVQTALVGLLRRFDPDALEARLTAGKFESLLPAARKARLWESFRNTYKTIASEAEDDFQAVFGRAFAKAYMAQTRKE